MKARILAVIVLAVVVLAAFVGGAAAAEGGIEAAWTRLTRPLEASGCFQPQGGANQ